MKAEIEPGASSSVYFVHKGKKDSYCYGSARVIDLIGLLKSKKLLNSSNIRVRSQQLKQLQVGEHYLLLTLATPIQTNHSVTIFNYYRGKAN